MVAALAHIYIYTIFQNIICSDLDLFLLTIHQWIKVEAGKVDLYAINLGIPLQKTERSKERVQSEV